MIKKTLFSIVIITSFLSCGCSNEVVKEIEKMDPITQTANMQRKAKDIADEAVMMKKYAEEMQRNELRQLQTEP